MKNKLLITATVVGAAANCYALNSIIQTIYTADPAPVVHDGVCYLYVDHDEDVLVKNFFTMKDWRCFSSTDMVNWTDHGVVASLRNFKWADPKISGWGGFDNGAWALQTIERDGKWYMYCPLQGRGIGVLVADNPFGPFADPIGKPLIGGMYDSIDPTVFIDNDGQAYLCWGNPRCWYVKLNQDMISYDTRIGDHAPLRTSHNPPAPELLELADQLGFLVLDDAFDTWGQNKRPNDYGGGNLFYVWHEQDLRALVRRDRNHPSIVLWSIGNEIAEQNQGSNSVIAKELAGIVHSEDPTRPVTAACNDFNAMDNGFSTLLDAMGFNYKPDNYQRFHQLYPREFIFATESASTISSRGEYFFPVTTAPFGTVNGRPRGGAQTFGSQDNTNHQVNSYDLYFPGWATSPDHEFFGQDHSAAVAGEFVWTGFDYIGEPTPWGGGNDPSRSSYFGIIDLAGFPKDRFYLYQAHWRPDHPMAHIVPQNWNWPDRAGQITPVHVYTSGDEAELFLNGKSMGRKKKIFDTPNNSRLNGQPAYRIRWDDVAYEPGELKVVAYRDGKAWATNAVKTAGEAKRLELQPDRAMITADGHDISFVTLRVLDQNGTVVPRSMSPIHFGVSGAGEIVATDNGDATDLTAFPSHDRKAFNGLAMVIVKAKRGNRGPITVTATSEGLKTARAKIKLK